MRLHHAFAGIGALCAVLLLPSTSSAFPPHLNHEGLVTEDGLPLDGRVTVSFRIYDDQDADDPVWTEIHDLDLVDGYYQVRLGDLEPFEGLFDSGSHYLGISIDDGPELGPRQPLGSVAYAMVAHNAVGDITARSLSVAGRPLIDADGNASGLVEVLRGSDGAGSGLDADRLDGRDSSEFVTTAEEVLALLLSIDGAGSGLDADRLDGITSSRFMRADQDSTSIANVRVDGNVSVGGNLTVEGAFELDLLTLSGRASPPEDPAPGTLYFDSESNTFRGFDGTYWVRLSSSGLGGSPRSPAASCQDILDKGHAIGNGRYWVAPEGAEAPIEVYCDMETDDGGYTMVRIDDGSLGGDQRAYFAMCQRFGMEIVVPRTREHALALRRWNDGEPPNLVNVYPRQNGARGLSNWTGRCQGQPCGFWMSDSDSANACAGFEPNGDNNTDNTIYRWGQCGGDPFGGWNDGHNRVDYRGWVICSTNDKSFPIGQSASSPGLDCAEILDKGHSNGSGTYWIQQPGRSAIQVHCDMETDAGGYTMVRFDHGSLAGDQTAYQNLCGGYGLEVIVPRTRAHAMAIKAWNGNVVPNLVNVFPKYNGASGLSNWTGKCKGRNCSFWMADGNSANCGWLEPNGDNNTGARIYRWNRCNDQPFGGWNDAHNRVDIRGWVICSTNTRASGGLGDDASNPGESCLDILDSGASQGNGNYWIQRPGRQATEVYCDMTTDGGGYTMVRYEGGLGGDQNQYRNRCAEYGLEVIVPRTRDHAMALKAWNNNEPPNLINVFPKYNGARYLSNWTGRCQGQRCTFWMSDGNSANCGWLEPNGDNNTGMAIYRWSRCSGDPFGGWNDAHNNIDIRGWVICSVNDK